MVGVRAWHNTTTLHPLALVIVLVAGIALIFLPRRYAILPMILVVCFIPSAQRLIVLGADFTLLRILVLFGWIRLFLQSEFRGFVWNRLDTLMVTWMVTGAVIFTMRWQSVSALVSELGWIFDGLGMYFLFRCILRGWEELEWMIRCFAFVSIPVAMAFLIEKGTGRNAFSIFGGVPPITIVRDGSLRCQGAYSHAILAGQFWASLVPLFISTWLHSKSLALLGIVCSIIIVLTCASSTPVMSIGFVIIGMSLYPLRNYVRTIRWSFFLFLVLVHLTWHRPVWYLIAKANVISGSTGYHRYAILDAAINNFSKWWLLGESDPMSWGVWQMRDVTNYYIAMACNGGVLNLLLFVSVLTMAFSMVGTALRRFQKERTRRIIIWCIGVSLFVHVCSFFAVSYFGQIIMLLYLTLALCGNLQSIIANSNDSSESVCQLNSAYLRPTSYYKRRDR